MLWGYIMTKRMLIDDTQPEETRVVIVDGNKVEDVEFESSSRKQIKGNIYTAKVIRIEPSLQAAFIDYGGNKHGFLAFNEIHPDYYNVSEEVLNEVNAEVDEIINNKIQYLLIRKTESLFQFFLFYLRLCGLFYGFPHIYKRRHGSGRAEGMATSLQSLCRRYIYKKEEIKNRKYLSVLKRKRFLKWQKQSELITECYLWTQTPNHTQQDITICTTILYLIFTQ